MVSAADGSPPQGIDPSLGEVGAHLRRNQVRASGPSLAGVDHVSRAVVQWAVATDRTVLRAGEGWWIVQSNASQQTFRVAVEASSPPRIDVQELHEGRDEPVTASAVLVEIDRYAMGISAAAPPTPEPPIHADYKFWVRPPKDVLPPDGGAALE